MHVLVLNAGSSTLKWTLLEGRDRTTIQSGQEWTAHEGDGQAQQIRATLRNVFTFGAVGHRVVSGVSADLRRVLDAAARARRARGSPTIDSY